MIEEVRDRTVGVTRRVLLHRSSISWPGVARGYYSWRLNGEAVGDIHLNGINY